MREATEGALSVGSCFGIVRSIAAGSGAVCASAATPAEAKTAKVAAAKMPKLNSRIEMLHPVELQDEHPGFLSAND
jgi:hypothetical protein